MTMLHLGTCFEAIGEVTRAKESYLNAWNMSPGNEEIGEKLENLNISLQGEVY